MNAWKVLFFLAAALLVAGCSGDDGAPGSPGPAGPPGTPGPAGPPGVSPVADLPGVVIEILSIAGGTGPGGNVQPGDSVSVTFSVKTDEGEDLDVPTMDSGSVYVSGPSFNYQRVIPSASDVRARAADNGDGTWTYAFAAPFPSVYAAPYNDTAAFGAQDGELTGQPLLDGTYTVGLQLYKNYSIDGVTIRDAGNATRDFLVGGAVALAPREVVTNGNCNVCHVDIRAHGSSRYEVKLCVLCHTAGAEDRNVAGAAGGTPGVSVEFKRMIHRIHNAAHLPSVNGVATNPDGTRNYAAAPAPLEYVGFNNAVSDLSDVNFPVWPSLNIAMPRDQGYSALTTSQKAQEDRIRTGVVACSKCHGDPDGSGPLLAPAQGGRHRTNPSREACGACHDDVDWTRPYTSNGSTMPANLAPDSCAFCHTPSGTQLSVDDAHLHPLLNPAVNPGLAFTVTQLSEAGANDGDGTIDPGERISVSFTITDDSGANLAPSSLASISLVVSGPTTNYNLLLSTSIPVAHPAFASGPTYTMNLPAPVPLEFAGASSDVAAEAFATSRSPHLAVTGAATTVFARTATSGGATSTVGEAPAFQNFLDVVGTSGFARNDYVVVDDGTGVEEYLQIALVDGTRLWFNQALRNAHGGGASVLEVTLTTRTAGTHYTLNAPAGVVTEIGNAFPAGQKVVVSYTSEFVMPAFYPPPLNDSPDLGESVGEWRGKPIVAGTYTMDVYGVVNRDVVLFGETNAYRGTSAAGMRDFLVGSATVLEPYAIISEPDNCYTCHDDLFFHGGGRRGFVTCVMCHGTAGAEDRPRYTAANAPATTKVSIGFREMLHKIHMGRHLTEAESYTVVGFGSASYPNNFTPHTYGEVGFPAMPGGVAHCSKCHGNDAWRQPQPRDHPTHQTTPARVWSFVCGSCHDSAAAHAHIDLNTFSGVESCAVCHGSGRSQDVAKVHDPK